MSTIEVQTIGTILAIYTKTWMLQIVAWPIVKTFFKDLPDKGWAIARFFLLIVSSLIIWELSYLGLPMNTNTGLMVIEAMLLLIAAWIVKRRGVKWLLPPKESFRLILLEEYLLVVGFVMITVTRAYMPNLDSLEKFMDYGFIVRYLNSATLPAVDMWQAGRAINYYSFGHYWASILVRFWGVVPEVGYNLVLGFIAGTSLSIAFCVINLFTRVVKKETGMVGAFLGSLVLVFGGNSHTAWYLLKNQSLKNYWYADATRFIHNTIHEFPGYSLVVSDLHGHLFDLPVALLFMVVFYLFSKKVGLFEQITLGVLFAVMMMTNTWDVPIYGLLLCVWMFYSLVNRQWGLWQGLKSTVVIFGAMSVVSALWWIKFEPISSGIAWVTLRSPFWQLMVLWGLALASNVLAWFFANKTDNAQFVKTLILTSIILIIIPEFIYAKDIYPDHPRANTMFKLTYQSFIMSGVVFGVLINTVIEKVREKSTFWRRAVVFVTMVIFCGVMMFPSLSFPAYYENFKTLRGLNGELWLKEKSPSKFSVIQFLKENKDGRNMVEAVGDSYTELNVVSAYSGVPSIQGWRVHEWLWRGGYDSVASREQLVKELYEGAEVEAVIKIVEDFKIGWIFVGPDEEEKYIINHPKLKSLGKVVWEFGEYYLITVD